MPAYQNPQRRIPRQSATPTHYRHVTPERPWALWTSLGIAAVAAAILIVWRLNYQERQHQLDLQVAALLVSADKQILANQEDEAEASVHKALELLPDDVRCVAMIERINKKREMVHKKQASADDLAISHAEQLTKGDVTAAIEAFGKIADDNSAAAVARKIAADRAASLKGGVCTLQLPASWPTDAIVSIDGIERVCEKNLVTGIVPGKHKIEFKRFGYREPAAMELAFRGLDPVQFPAFEWRLRGTKVSITSRPWGASVWQNGKDLGKVTPCTLEDVDDGRVEFLLKLADHADTTVEGEVKDRKPLKLSATMPPLQH